MILILSDENDQCTNEVIDWIVNNNKKYLRINPSDIITNIEINPEFEFSFILRDQKIMSKDLSGFWYRRGYLNLRINQLKDSEFLLSEILNKHLRSENSVLRNFVLKELTRKNSIGDYFNTDVNKFELLKRAKEHNLRIPETLVTTSKQELTNFLTKHKSIVTKSSSEVIMQDKEGISVVSFTKRIGLDDLTKIDETFSSSLFQEEISKRYELRIFFLDEKFYPMAIFSQLDDQTAVDFRVYNRTKPNRTVPCKLPDEIILNLVKLLKACDFNTGSIDMIVTEDDEYIFLEINPVGQFDMVSFPCNYYLHKQIANRLCS